MGAALLGAARGAGGGGARPGDLRAVAVWPPAGFEGGGSRVTVVGASLHLARWGHRLRCRFGEDTLPPAPGLEGGGGRWGLHSVGCGASPPHAPGFVTVGLVPADEPDFGSFGSGHGEGPGAAAVYQFLPRPVVTSAAPFVLDAAGGRLVLGGLDFLSSPQAPLRCFFLGGEGGGGPPGRSVPARFVSSALLECGELPGGRAGLGGRVVADWRVEVGLDRPATESRVGFRAYRGIDSVSLTSLSPEAGEASGGQLVEVRAGGLPQFGDPVCRVGTVTGVAARRAAADRLECPMPAHAPRAVGVTLGLREGQLYMRGELGFQFWDGSETKYTAPEWISATASATVRVHGSGLPPAPRCSFSIWEGVAVGRGRGWVECSLPGNVRGFTALSLKDAAGPGLGLEIAEPAVVLGAAPAVVEMKAGEGVVFHISGMHMRTGGECSVALGGGGREGGPGGVWGSGISVSTALTVCEVHIGGPSKGGELQVILRQGGGISPGAPVLLMPPLSAHPVDGVLRAHEGGGQRLRFEGSNMANAKDLSCKLGSIGPVSGEWLSPSSMQCTSVAHRVGRAPLVAGLRSQLPHDRGDTVEFAAGVGFSSIQPGEGASKHGTTLEAHFDETRGGAQLLCRLGDKELPAERTRAGAPSALCVLPSAKPGFVRIEVGEQGFPSGQSAIFKFIDIFLITSIHI